MKKHLEKALKDKFVVAWVVGLMVLSVVLGGRLLIFASSGPSMEDVLARNQVAAPPPDLSLVIASLLALSLATVSVAKGYEIYKRNRSMSAVVLPEHSRGREAQPPAAEHGAKEIAELKKSVDALNRENSELKSSLKMLMGEFKELEKVEKMLRKSNISLSRECERLTSENEILTLKVNSLKAKPSKRGNGKAKRKARARVKHKRGKKKSRK